ncbi:MAG TPA: DUF2071 domain-containing protein [Methylomirabilota bacterium]|nr:DUF2071 domain-containing protein [Methylomirabilota bacterium]
MRSRSRSRPPLFIANWADALFLHYEIDADKLQPFVPFQLDLRDGGAFVSLVAFTMREMRFAKFGALGAWLCRPMATHEFLNLRTYVRHRDEVGICFLAEWLPNRLSVWLGPLLYALPYRHAAIHYCREGTRMRGSVTARGGAFSYEGELDHDDFAECSPGSLDEFLLERYVAFNAGHFPSAESCAARRSFHVWHDAWPQTRAEIRVIETDLLRNTVPWWPHAKYVGANYSPGVRGVCMSAPRRIP